MVPKGWKSQFPVELVTFFSGFAFKSEDATSEGARWLKIANVGVGEIKWDSESYLPKNYLTEYKKFLLEVGDIVVAMTRPTLGKYLKIAKLNKCEDKSLLNQRVAKLVVADAVDSNFIYHLFRTEKIAYLINTALLGTDPPNLSVSVLRDFKVLVPPLLEQKKIAQILSTWDKVISVTEKLLINSQQQKKALMQQLLTGKKRLLDENGVRFSEEWIYSTFDNAFIVANKKSAQVKSSDYLQTGSVPIIDQGQNRIAGYCNNVEVYSDVPVIIFGDHTRCIKWIEFMFCPGADGTQVIKTSQRLEPKFGYYLLSNTDIPNLGYSRHMRELKEKDFRLPLDIKEQQKIADVLSAADAEISILEKKLTCLKDEKKALMQQLLTGKRRVKVEAEEAVSA